MHVRRTILCLATIFFWAAHDPDVASGQSSELMEAYNSYITLYQQGRYSEAEPYAKEALRLGTEEFGPNDPSTVVYVNNLAFLYYTRNDHHSITRDLASCSPQFPLSNNVVRRAKGPDVHRIGVAQIHNPLKLLDSYE